MDIVPRRRRRAAAEQVASSGSHLAGGIYGKCPLVPTVGVGRMRPADAVVGKLLQRLRGKEFIERENAAGVERRSDERMVDHEEIERGRELLERLITKVAKRTRLPVDRDPPLLAPDP